ncbi:phage tail assembly protein [Halodesulfovibrio aestuarii]|uniref:Phage tail assembly protein n=1 Tax=Halodesulfovibrio aestuarii TaxID=126333 RepID=A0ABV4JXF7_9BACT
MPTTTTITLDSSVVYNGETYTKLTMREPLVRDQRAVSKLADDSEIEIRMFSMLCDVSDAVLDVLTLKDFLKLQKAYQDFLS